MKLVTAWLTCVLALCLCNAASAQTKIKIAFTANPDTAPAFVALEEGLFKKRNLDVELVQIRLTSDIPGALLSDSVQVGGASATSLLQASEGGIDLVAVAGSSVTDSRTAKDIGLVAKTGISIKSAMDVSGKKVGIPGIGGILDTLFREWLRKGGVKLDQVTFVEATLQSQGDLLRAGSLDAVVTGGPILLRIVASGAGSIAANFTRDLPAGMPIILYASTRDWAKSNAVAAKAFRDAIEEGGKFMAANPDKTREHIAKYTKIPLEVVKTVEVPVARADVTVEQLSWLGQVMRDQGLLKKVVEPAKLIEP
jgi:NitT/TauT family transport system substrate-binding protein